MKITQGWIIPIGSYLFFAFFFAGIILLRKHPGSGFWDNVCYGMALAATYSASFFGFLLLVFGVTNPELVIQIFHKVVG